MEADIIRRGKEISVQAVLAAGRTAREHFDNIAAVNEKGDFGDVVTEVDYQIEEIILKGIRGHFPDHQILSEEAGHNGKTATGCGWSIRWTAPTTMRSACLYSPSPSPSCTGAMRFSA